MAKRRTRRARKPLPTIWRCPDDLWDHIIKPLLDEHDPPAKTGRSRIDPRGALDGIIYILRTGAQWCAVPREFGDDSSVHRTFQRWVNTGLFDRMLEALLHRADELGEIEWRWQSADGVMGRARKGGTRSARTPRIAGKTARSVPC